MKGGGDMKTGRLLRSRRGEALILVICVMAVFASLALTLLLSAGGVVKSAQERARSEQLRVAAVTLSRAVEANLTGETDALTPADGTLCAYLRQRMTVFGGNWQYYNENEAGRNLDALTRSFSVPLPDGFGDILSGATLSLYWKSESAVMNNTDAAARYESVVLVAVVECRGADGGSCRFQSSYGLRCDVDGTGAPTAAHWYAKGAES